MKPFIRKIFIADAVILLVQAVLLLMLSYYGENDNYNFKILTHAIFTMKKNIILFINPPITILIFYIHLCIKHKINETILKCALLGLLNFIFLYFASWIEMLALVSLKLKV